MSFSPEPPGPTEGPPRIHQIHAYIMTDTKGKEDIALYNWKGRLYPLVFIEETRLPDFAPHVAKLRRDGLKVTLARFTVRTDLEDTPT